eukprot:GILK01010883.1.p1 GENE.GILK01010883.1~~GILK01010883.1.p1  ORF type:complete len:637 (-),score=112.79 GILK01010883.1:35-1945(-)
MTSLRWGNTQTAKPLDFPTLKSRCDDTPLADMYELDLHALCLTSVSKEVECCVRLRSLDLSLNNLEAVPENIRRLNELRELKLHSNMITSIEHVDQCPLLQNLYLHDNGILRISSLRGLRKLQLLRLDMNNISRVEGLEDLTELTSLNLSRNQLTKVDGLRHLSHLQELHLSHNRIEAIDSKELEGSRMLHELHLGDNLLTDAMFLKACKRLEVLRLDGNRISSWDVFPRCGTLNELFISRNGLSTLLTVGDLFPLLEILDVSENCIRNVKDLIGLKKIAGLMELRIEGNQVKHMPGFAEEISKILPGLDYLDNGPKIESQLIRPGSRSGSTTSSTSNSASTQLASIPRPGSAVGSRPGSAGVSRPASASGSRLQHSDSSRSLAGTATANGVSTAPLMHARPMSASHGNRAVTVPTVEELAVEYNESMDSLMNSARRIIRDAKNRLRTPSSSESETVSNSTLPTVPSPVSSFSSSFKSLSSSSSSVSIPWTRPQPPLPANVPVPPVVPTPAPPGSQSGSKSASRPLSSSSLSSSSSSPSKYIRNSSPLRNGSPVRSTSSISSRTFSVSSPSMDHPNSNSSFSKISSGSNRTAGTQRSITGTGRPPIRPSMKSSGKSTPSTPTSNSNVSDVSSQRLL